MKHRLQFALLCFALGLSGLLYADEAQEPPLEGVIEIEDTSTTVALVASVHLTVGQLEMRGGKLTGDYATRVPLRSSKNEDGLILLDYEHSFEHLQAYGGTLKGIGTSPDKPGEERTIICVVIPDENDRIGGTIELTISTSKRTMDFVSRYRVVEIDNSERPDETKNPAQE